MRVRGKDRLKSMRVERKDRLKRIRVERKDLLKRIRVCLKKTWVKILTPSNGFFGNPAINLQKCNNNKVRSPGRRMLQISSTASFKFLECFLRMPKASESVTFRFSLPSILRMIFKFFAVFCARIFQNRRSPYFGIFPFLFITRARRERGVGKGRGKEMTSWSLLSISHIRREKKSAGVRKLCNWLPQI